MVIVEATEKKNIIEWEGVYDTRELPVLPHYNPVFEFWYYNPERKYGGQQSDHTISEEQAKQIAKGIEIPKGHKIIESRDGFQWMRRVVNLKDVGLGHPAWVQ